MQVRRRNDCLAGAQCVRERAGNDLGLVLVRRDVNVRRADQFNHLVRAHEAIPEDYIGLNPQIGGELLQVSAVLVTFTPQNMRMSRSGHHVNDIAVT